MRRTVALLLALAGASCDGGGGSTGPEEGPFRVTITERLVVQGERSQLPDGRVRVTCSYTVQATGAGGPAGTFAIWDGGVLEWRKASGAGEDETLSINQMASWFGSDLIPTGVTRTANRYLYWDGPFTANHVFRFRMPTGEIQSASFLLDCR